MPMVIFSVSFQIQNCGQTFLGAGGGGPVECEGAGGVEGKEHSSVVSGLESIHCSVMEVSEIGLT